MGNDTILNELKNVLVLFDLLWMDKRIPTNSKRIIAKQNRRVRRLMKRAYKIPFYRKRFEKAGLTPRDFNCADDLAKFPLLTRGELREWMEEEIAAAPNARWSVHTTSGSSGVPLRFIVTAREDACVTANWIRVTMFAGYKPLFKRMLSYQKKYTGEQTNSADSWIQKLGILQRRVVPEELYAEGGLGELVELINSYKPNLICFRRNLLVRIADYAEKNNIPLHQPDLYFPISEMIDDVSRRTLERAYGDGLADAYGCEELANCALKCPGSEYFYIYNDTHVLNAVDNNGNITNHGTLVGTTLYKKDFPFINYVIGDIADTAVVDGVRVIKHIVGRSNDLVLHADGSESASTGLRKVADSCVGITQFRFVQHAPNEIEIVLVKDAKSPRSNSEIEDAFVRGIEQLYPSEFKLCFSWKDVIPPDSNGKMRCFVREC